jgi:predicted phosphohydrolase
MDTNQKWIKKHPLQVKGDILLLGGDIMLLGQQEHHHYFLDFIAANYTATYWIPGNHEYYHGDINPNSCTLHKAIRDNVFLVNNITVPLGNNADLICSTLWSQLNPADGWHMMRALSDFKLIKNGSELLSIDTYNQLHAQAKQFIEQAVANSTAHYKIVLSHHVPTFMNYPQKHRGDVLNQAFATELHDFIATSGISHWLYGHIHTNTPDFMIAGTQLLTNQLGYVRYGENKHFDSGKTFLLH